MYYGPGGVLEAKCATDITNFPVDTQKCILEFHSWSSGAESYKFIALSDKIDMNFYSDNSNWNIIKTATYVKFHNDNENKYYSYFVEIEIKRAPAYHVVMVILPTI